jgi:hypothetical protein
MSRSKYAGYLALFPLNKAQRRASSLDPLRDGSEGGDFFQHPSAAGQARLATNDRSSELAVQIAQKKKDRLTRARCVAGEWLASNG